MHPTTIDRDSYLKDFFEYDLKVPCPKCNGRLIFDCKDKKPIVKVLDKESLEVAQDNDMAIAYGEYLWGFSGEAKCRNCDAFVILSGRSTILPCKGNSCPTGRECAEDYFSNSFPDIDPEYKITHYHHKITHIDPVPDMFLVDWLDEFEGYKNLQKILRESFGLYWIDEYACANRIGVAIECFEKESRIKNYQDEENSSLVEKLTTLHYLRHAGSHYHDYDVVISREDILNAFDILNYVLVNFFKITENYEKEIIDKRRKLDRFSTKKKVL